MWMTAPQLWGTLTNLKQARVLVIVTVRAPSVRSALQTPLIGKCQGWPDEKQGSSWHSKKAQQYYLLLYLTAKLGLDDTVRP
jgi:hypothetical protein